MADAGKVMFLGLRMQAIEKELKEAKVIVEALKVAEYHFDEYPEDLQEDFENVARSYDIKFEELQKSYCEARADWKQASHAYRRERYGEE